ncbi:MAG: hypothetical protein ACK5P7_11355 [Bdellovibrio sp.]
MTFIVAETFVFFSARMSFAVKLAFFCVSLFTSLVSAKAPRHQSICTNQTARQVMSQPNFFRPVSELKSVIEKNDLILLGELHFDLPGSRQAVIQALAALTTEKTCFFYELRSNKTIQQHLIEMRRPYYELNLEQFSEIHSAAIAAKMIEITVDSDNESQYNMDLPNLNERNEVMARNMAAALQSGLCKKGILIVGKSHLEREGADWLNIQDYLKPHAIKAVAINLQNSKERIGFSSDPELSSWNGVCPKRTGLAIFRDLRFFEHKDLPQTLSFQPIAKRPTGAWRDFDYTILLPVK